jgi:hypothetical protein
MTIIDKRHYKHCNYTDDPPQMASILPIEIALDFSNQRE